MGIGVSASLTLSDFVLRSIPSPCERQSAGSTHAQPPPCRRGLGVVDGEAPGLYSADDPVMSAPRGLAYAVTPPSVSRNMHRAKSGLPCLESNLDFPSSPQSGLDPCRPPQDAGRRPLEAAERRSLYILGPLSYMGRLFPHDYSFFLGTLFCSILVS